MGSCRRVSDSHFTVYVVGRGDVFDWICFGLDLEETVGYGGLRFFVWELGRKRDGWATGVE